jgi:hypothetical protein
VVFLFPWAAVMRHLGPLAWVEAAVFVGILGVGLAYVWRKGDIDWIPLHGHQPGSRLRTGSDHAPAQPPVPSAPAEPIPSRPAIPGAPAAYPVETR